MEYQQLPLINEEERNRGTPETTESVKSKKKKPF